jgi:hypothetical protein
VDCAFLFASFALGKVRDFYEQVWWWDLALHGSSSFVTGLIGFLAVFVFYMTQRVRVAAMSPIVADKTLDACNVYRSFDLRYLRISHSIQTIRSE